MVRTSRGCGKHCGRVSERRVWREYCGRGYGAYSTLGGVASTVWVWQWYVQHSRGCGKHCVGVAIVCTAL